MDIILFSLWFFLPAGYANVTPILVGRLPLFKKYSYPLDFFKTFQGKRVFGSHKTIRGFVAGIIVSIITVYVQVYLYNTNDFFKSVSIINYSIINPLYLGFLFGFGALGGDVVKSFFKRRFLIDSGKSWFLFDQSDYIFGALLLTSLYIRISWVYYISIFIIWFLLHIASSLLGFALKLKDTPL